MKYFIQMFGCQQNQADSERIASLYQSRGFTPATGFEDTDVAIINTCVVRQQAEDRVYGLIENLKPLKAKNPNFKIVITGCLVGAAMREPSGERLRALHRQLPQVDEFLPIEEVGFEYAAVRTDDRLGFTRGRLERSRNGDRHALVPISNGCNNFCTFCIVPFSRGREHSRPFEAIISEAEHLAGMGYRELTLVGQNVNSYGADLVKEAKTYRLASPSTSRSGLGDGTTVTPVMVKHLGRHRIPTLFPQLLERVARIPNIKKISFISSNPWDFSDELITVIARHPNISRVIHLPVQSGDDEVLRRMNRWYTAAEYAALVQKIRRRVGGVTFTTDVIVGFPGETVEAFQRTIELARAVGFDRAFIACYSPRTGTAAAKTLADDVPRPEKQRRFLELDKLINYRLRPEFKT